jgi:hypothetical protein
MGLDDQIAEIALLFSAFPGVDTPLPQLMAPVSDKPSIEPRNDGQKDQATKKQSFKHPCASRSWRAEPFRFGILTVARYASNRLFGGIYLKSRLVEACVLAAASLGVPFLQHL